MKRIRKIAMVFAVVAIAAMSLSAATWVWSTPYDNVTGYRYQIGSESEEGWIYVDKDVTSLTLDRSEETTIYVQLTVDDGRFWSPSGVATYVPQSVLPVENLTNQNQDVVDPDASGAEDDVLENIPAAEEPSVEDFVVEETPAVEEPVEETPVEEVAPEEVAPVEEVAVLEDVPVDETVFVEAVPVKKGRDFNFSLGFSVETEIGQSDMSLAFNPILNFKFQNVASPADWFGLDINMNIVGLFQPDADLKGGFIKFMENFISSNISMGGGAELILRPTFMVNNFEFGLSLGGGANIYAASTLTGTVLEKTPSLYKDDAVQINAYALAGADVTISSRVVDFGIGYRFRYIFDEDIKNGSQMTHGVAVSLGFNF